MIIFHLFRITPTFLPSSPLSFSVLALFRFSACRFAAHAYCAVPQDETGRIANAVLKGSRASRAAPSGCV
ncbi:MAG: hypothetical protein DBX55_00200 [Verrucomicrobia bacterium]|nr:MAG: hypothetical protein DBX55_00200 [Verrucomicrobiota bacterium]